MVAMALNVVPVARALIGSLLAAAAALNLCLACLVCAAAEGGKLRPAVNIAYAAV